MAPFSEQFGILAAHCQAAIDRSGPLMLALLIAGLVGSAAHCAGMCGPFVLAQVGARDVGAGSEGRLRGLSRLAGPALLPYHLGRATTYVALGMLVAAPVGFGAGLARLSWLPPLMLTLAAALFLWQALRSLGLVTAWAATPNHWLTVRLARPLLGRPLGFRGYLLGVVLGFLPCGLLYSALGAAAATADPIAAGLAMTGFVLGTMPMLITMGFAGYGAARRWHGLAQKALPYVAALNATVLLFMATRMAGLA